MASSRSRKDRSARTGGSGKDATKASRSSKASWRLLDTGATLASAVLARQVSTLTWRAATGHRPPTKIQHPELRTVEAVTWAVLVGATIELTKVIVNRQAAQYWVRSTGQLPPGLKPLTTMTPEDLDAARAQDEADLKKAVRKRR